jgi:hypothetical protein
VGVTSAPAFRKRRSTIDTVIPETAQPLSGIFPTTKKILNQVQDDRLSIVIPETAQHY